jgi:hypothetical protein
MQRPISINMLDVHLAPALNGQVRTAKDGLAQVIDAVEEMIGVASIFQFLSADDSQLVQECLISRHQSVQIRSNHLQAVVLMRDGDTVNLRVLGYGLKAYAEAFVLARLFHEEEARVRDKRVPQLLRQRTVLPVQLAAEFMCVSWDW